MPSFVVVNAPYGVAYCGLLALSGAGTDFFKSSNRRLFDLHRFLQLHAGRLQIAVGNLLSRLLSDGHHNDFANAEIAVYLRNSAHPRGRVLGGVRPRPRGERPEQGTTAPVGKCLHAFNSGL